MINIEAYRDRRVSGLLGDEVTWKERMKLVAVERIGD